MTLREDENWSRRIDAALISITLAALAYLGFSLWAGWREVSAALVQIGLGGCLLALSMSLINYGLRFVRWQCYLNALQQRVDLFKSARIYISGFALTTTPGKAGELLRAYFLKRLKVPYPVTLAAFFSERLSDLVAVVALTLVGLSAHPEYRPVLYLGVSAIAILLACISSRRLLHKLQAYTDQHRSNSRLSHARELIVETLLKARRCHQPHLLLLASFLSFIAWGAEALAFHWVLQWLNVETTLNFAIFIYSISMLAGALSFIPGGLGSAEAVMISLLMLQGAEFPTAIAATVFIRLATLWFAVLLGAIALFASRPGASSRDTTFVE